MSNLIQGYASTTVHVRNFEAARKFYRDVLGLKELSADPSAHQAYYQVPGSNVPLAIHVYEGYCATTMKGREPGTVSGLVFVNPDPFRAAQEIKKRGGRITDEPEKRPWGAVTFTVADPDGNEFVVTEPAAPGA